MKEQSDTKKDTKPSNEERDKKLDNAARKTYKEIVLIEIRKEAELDDYKIKGCIRSIQRRGRSKRRTRQEIN
jgi:hypothetical protein